jgi:hypothetical protein
VRPFFLTLWIFTTVVLSTKNPSSITTAHPWEVSYGALPFERLSVDLSYRDSSSFRQHTHTVVTKQYTTYSTE